ncbi:MAG: NADH-quinone oxidoreductase subunit NuoH [Phycisphaerales bacterium]|nr:MAG: NADH-quinone oxidoreductase subunit NuoH [Phycisphaerales bacterium]
MAEFFTSQLGVSVGLAVFALLVLLGAVSYCIYFERKISAFVQDRYGPNRVGPFGIFQPVADGGKFVFKEDVIPGHVDKPLFLLAPCITFLVGFIVFAAIPWGGQWSLGGRLIEVQVANPDIGLLYILGVASVGVYGVILGSWASNNKYSFYGGMRAAAQMLSYEIPMGICILVVVITMGSLRLEEITVAQTDYWLGFIPQWNIFRYPLAFVILFVTVLAECNRTPFDVVEAEQELVGGFHTEYGALKFGMFFLAEYAHMITSSALIAVLFLGGWHFPWIPWTQLEATSWFAVLLKILVICGKISFFIFVMMWIRWTLPRFRFDQLMRLAWKGLIPITLSLFVLAVVLLYFGVERSFWYPLIGNVLVLAVALFFAARSRREVTGRQRGMPAVGGGSAGRTVSMGIPG